MITDVIALGAYTVLIEQSNSSHPKSVTCKFEDDAIGFAFYGSASVKLVVSSNLNLFTYKNTSGTTISFFGNSNVTFTHHIANDRPLQCVTVFIKKADIKYLAEHERAFFDSHLYKLAEPENDFVEGPQCLMTNEMQQAVRKILTTTYTGAARVMFLKSQITELLAHFFALLNQHQLSVHPDVEKIIVAREILMQRIDAPPSLQELAKLAGINQQKLKIEFKARYGAPIFQYLHHERLNHAFDLLRKKSGNIQQVANAVGYESLSSFSNAFAKKFGVRPSALKQ